MSLGATGAELLSFTGGQWAAILGALAVGLLIHVSLVVWLHRDVQAAARNPWPWTVPAALLLTIPVFVVWRFVRPRPHRSRPAADPTRRASPTAAGPMGSGSAERRPLPSSGHSRAAPYPRASPSSMQPQTMQRPSASLQYASGMDGVTCMVCGEEADRVVTGSEEMVTCPGCGTRHPL